MQSTGPYIGISWDIGWFVLRLRMRNADRRCDGRMVWDGYLQYEDQICLLCGLGTAENRGKVEMSSFLLLAWMHY